MCGQSLVIFENYDFPQIVLLFLISGYCLKTSLTEYKSSSMTFNRTLWTSFKL